ncbi:hypothetical protein O181_001359 [Austropuccinia psidii MF-1]|uniref:Uncharacterized protein n=1 Tax=Austropuccinia psidii MF-1 TaxID=1389203 RepID=A0A9Q3BAC3_9BASI|nr:hypothetical protein [Austropuccinia psidii MF-1]
MFGFFPRWSRTLVDSRCSYQYWFTALTLWLFLDVLKASLQKFTALTTPQLNQEAPTFFSGLSSNGCFASSLEKPVEEPHKSLGSSASPPDLHPPKITNDIEKHFDPTGHGRVICSKRPRFDLNNEFIDLDDSGQTHFQSSSSDSGTAQSLPTYQTQPLFDLNIASSDFKEANREPFRDSPKISQFSHKQRKKSNQGQTLEDETRALTDDEHTGSTPSCHSRSFSHTLLGSSIENKIKSEICSKKQSLDILGIENPKYEEFFPAVQNFFYQLFGKIPDENPEFKATFDKQWKLMSEQRVLRGIPEKIVKEYDSIFDYDNFVSEHGSIRLLTCKPRLRAEFHATVVAGNSLFRQLNLATAELVLLNELNTKWRAQEEKLIRIRETPTSYPYQRLLELVDYSNKAVLTKISQLNQLYLISPFGGKDISNVQRQAFGFLDGLWRNVDLFHSGSDFMGKLGQSMFKTTEQRGGKYKIYNLFSWKIFLFFFHTEFGRFETHHSFKNALNDILYQELFYHVDFKGDIELFPKHQFRLKGCILESLQARKTKTRKRDKKKGNI